MRFFDLHCDTVSTCMAANSDLFKNQQQLDIERGCTFEKWVQTFAFWIEDMYRGEQAYLNFLAQYDYFCKQMETYGDLLCLYENGKVQSNHCNAVLSIEGGAVLNSQIERISELKAKGISMMTLVWNGENEIAGGVLASTGLKPFGKEVVREMERQNIIVDISHLNAKGFDDVCNIATKPIVATHSNTKTICNHSRNLTNEQIKYIVDNKGLIGINFYPLFINGYDNCTYEEIFAHIDLILSLGGEQILAIGSDFDGATMPKCLSQIKKLEKFYEYMVKYYHEELVEKFFYQNAITFFEKNLKIQ